MTRSWMPKIVAEFARIQKAGRRLDLNSYEFSYEQRRPRRRQGVALMGVLVALTAFSFSMAAIAWQTVASHRFLQRRQYQYQSTWLARSGLEIALAHLRSDPKYTCEEAAPIPQGRVKIKVGRIGNPSDKKDKGAIFEITSEARYPADSPRVVVRSLTRRYRRSNEGKEARLVAVALEKEKTAPEDSGSKLHVTETPDYVQIDSDTLQARINKKGYVSGIARGSFLDRKTGARDAGFGLHIMDFLLGPGWKDDGYSRDARVHGNLPKHYVEGPQICTQAKELQPEIIRGKDFVAVRLRFRFTKPAKGYKAGSLWEQTLVFQPGLRYFLSSEKITSVNDVDNVFYRIDMPGHIQHKKADTFSQVYLSYHGKIPASEFAKDFAPDARFLYQRSRGKIPQRMIRAYQLKVNGKPGPWLAGMTLDPAAVSEAWCHQRGYVCFIQELYGKKVRAGESFGAAYVVGYFDDIPAMEKTYDRFKGSKGISVSREGFRLEK